ncbi:MAG: hypothetical protein ABI343_20750 [Burkholderiaceae bacterium]
MGDIERKGVCHHVGHQPARVAGLERLDGAGKRPLIILMDGTWSQRA